MGEAHGLPDDAQVVELVGLALPKRACDPCGRHPVEERVAMTAFQLSHQLRTGTPAVYVNESRLHEGVLALHAIGLEERLIKPLIERLRVVVSA